MKNLEIQLWATMKSQSGLAVTYRSDDQSFDVIVVPHGTRQLRYGFGGQPLAADSRVFVIPKEDIPEPKPGDTLKFDDEIYSVASSGSAGPSWMPFGRFGVLIKIHTVRKWSADV